jgi:hypothetical protein
MIKLISYIITSGEIWILIFLFITVLLAMIKNKFKINVRLIFAHEIELFILLILFTIIIIITAIRHPVLNNFITESSSDEKIGFIQFIIEAELLVIALLILTRITYTRISFMIASYILLSGWLVSRFIFDTIPSLKFVNETTVPGLFERGLFVSTYIATTFRQLIVYFVSFLLGLYCVRKSFQYWKFCIGFIAGNFITYLLFLNDKSFSLLEFIFFLVVIILPLQKKALERLCGFPLKPRQSPELPFKTSFLSSAFQHFTILIILFCVCFFTIFGFYERNLFRVIKNGPKPIHYSPAAHNAYNDCKELFTKKVSKKIDESTYSFFPKYDLIINSTPPELIKRTFNIIDKNELEKSLSKLLPYIKTFEEARNADYCLYYESKYRAVPDFYNFRETTRFLGIRAMLRMYENRNEEALYDIETILNTAWLINNNGSLVVHMVGGALRGIGLKVAHNYYLKFRGNPEAINLLDEMLKRVEHKVRVSFPIENLKRYEPALWEIVPYFEFIVPGFTKAYITFYGKWVQYDQLVLSVALEKYRNEYKTYPDKLEELVPKYLEQLPLDPFKAKPYIYKNLGSEFSVSCGYLDSEPYEFMKKGKFYYKGLVFPPSKVENEELRKEIEKLERDKN